MLLGRMKRWNNGRFSLCSPERSRPSSRSRTSSSSSRGSSLGTPPAAAAAGADAAVIESRERVHQQRQSDTGQMMGPAGNGGWGEERCFTTARGTKGERTRVGSKKGASLGSGFIFRALRSEFESEALAWALGYKQHVVC